MKKLCGLLIAGMLLFYCPAATAASFWQGVDTTHSVSDVNKSWSVSFSEAVAPECISSTYFFITDASGADLPVLVSTSADNKTIFISPQQPYTANTSYTLHVAAGIKGETTGSLLGAEILYPFACAAALPDSTTTGSATTGSAVSSTGQPMVTTGNPHILSVNYIPKMFWTEIDVVTTNDVWSSEINGDSMTYKGGGLYVYNVVMPKAGQKMMLNVYGSGTIAAKGPLLGSTTITLP